MTCTFWTVLSGFPVFGCACSFNTQLASVCYSHHATDPCSGRLVNSFDMTRLHLFGDEDDEAKPDTPAANLPSSSYRNMYWLSLLQLGQYISLTGSKVVGSKICIPMKLAALRAIGSYSSAVQGSSSGKMRSPSYGPGRNCTGRVLYKSCHSLSGRRRASSGCLTRDRLIFICCAGLVQW